MTKYERIDDIIVKLDALVDRQGIAKCRTVLELVGELATLKNQLTEEDAAKNVSPLPGGGQVYKIKEEGE